MAVMRITEAERIVREALGEGYNVVKLSGTWFIRTTDDKMITPATGGRRKLELAIHDARIIIAADNDGVDDDDDLCCD